MARASEEERLTFFAAWFSHRDRIERALQFFFRQIFFLPGNFSNGAAGLRALLRNFSRAIVTDFGARDWSPWPWKARPIHGSALHSQRYRRYISRRKHRQTFASSRIDSRRSCAITGIMTLSSKFPFAAAHVMQVSLPIT